MRLRGLAERLRGTDEDSYRASRDTFPPLTVIAVSVVLFVVIFTLRMTDTAGGSGYALLFSIPIAILALRFGVVGGLIAAVVAELLFVVAATTVVEFTGVIPYVTRAVTFVTLGVLVGYLTERLAENEARFILTLRSASIFAFTMDRDLRYTWVYHASGPRVSQAMVGKTDAELIPPEHAGPIIALKKRVLAGGEAESAELPSVDLDGELRWFRVAVEPLRDATGRVTGLTGSALEVSELREAYEELARSEERFRGAVESLLEPFAIYTAVRDGEGKIVDFRCDFINTVGAETVGMKPSTMRGELLSKLFPGRLELDLIDRYTKVVETGDPHMRDAVDYVNIFGERELVRAFDMVIAKFGDGVQVIWRDITDRKRAEAERDRLAGIVDASIDAIMSADIDGTVKSWSAGAERLYGWTADEMIGEKFMVRLIPENLREIRGKVFARVASGEAVGPIASRELRKDGTSMRVSFTATPIFDANGEIVGAARIVRPIDRPDEYFTIDEESAAAGD